jgi:uncharacterized repeat protein (TIGR03806 family)
VSTKRAPVYCVLHKVTLVASIRVTMNIAGFLVVGGAVSLGLFAVSLGCSSGTPAGTPGSAGSTGAAGSAGSAGITGTAGAMGTAGAAGTAGATGTAGAGTDGGAGSGTAGASQPDGGKDAPGDTVPPTAACAPPADPTKPIAKLSETGCVDPMAPTKLAAIVLPYEVNSPLWSDNADKMRGMVIPAGKRIHVKDCAATSAECPKGPQDTGKWVLPVGTVMVKSFLFDGKYVETRLLVHPDATTWNGYSYQWNAAQTEATIVPPDEDAILNNMRAKVSFNTGKRTVDWIFPYRFDCGGCHTKPAGGTLGPETRQMNRVVGGMNQIDRWNAMNLFETAPKTPYQAALVLPYDGQLGTVPAGATIEQRARSYLHANCAYCHRPDDDNVNWMDFRLDTALKDTGACGITPMKGDVGVQGSQIFKPGKPMESAMWLRMNAPPSAGKTRMPQLATYVVDAQGLKLIGDWITSIAACPP